MEPIPVKPHPIGQTFDTLEDAIDHARKHPLRNRAKTDAGLLRGTTLVDARWSLGEFILEFSNKKRLHIFVSEHFVRWRLIDSLPDLSDVPCRIGTPPVQLDWKGTVGVHPLTASELMAKRVGAEFIKLSSYRTNDREGVRLTSQRHL